MDLSPVLAGTIEAVKPLDDISMQKAAARWDSIAKPLHSLGKLEDLVVLLAGIVSDPEPSIKKKAVIVMCADNGVVDEGVTQTGREVTAVVAGNIQKGCSSVCTMGRYAGADILPFDIGIVTDTLADRRYKVRYGTANMANEPAMTRQEALQAIEAGISIAAECRAAGYELLATGEMGIGNTTTSSAVASVLTGCSVELMTGRGAGLTSAGLKKKIDAIHRAIARNRPDPGDPVDVLAKVGGLDLAALTGLYLGCAAHRIPLVMDGFISCTAALAASALCPLCLEYIIPSHRSAEPGAVKLLQILGKDPLLYGNMCLGEGTGAVTLFPILDIALAVYDCASTFKEIAVEQYKELK